MDTILIDTIEEHWSTFLQRAEESNYTEEEADAFMDKFKEERGLS